MAEPQEKNDHVSPTTTTAATGDNVAVTNQPSDKTSDSEKIAETETEAVEHVEASPTVAGETSDKHRKAGISYIQQQHTIPTTGKRIPTSKWEYIFFCVFCKFLLFSFSYLKQKEKTLTNDDYFIKTSPTMELVSFIHSFIIRA